MIPLEAVETAGQQPQKFPFERSTDFVRSANRAGVPGLLLLQANTPIALRTTEQGLVVVNSYYLSDLSLVDIADEIDCSKTEANRKRGLIFTNLWSNSPSDIKCEYPLHLLERNKPKTLREKMKHSAGQEGLAPEIAKALAQGMELGEIQTQYNLSVDELQKIRYRLRIWGITLPTFKAGYDRDRELREMKPSEMNDKEKQSVLNKFTYRNFRLHGGKGGILTGLKDVAELAGLKFSGGLAPIYAQELADYQVPFAEIDREIKSGDRAGEHMITRFLFRADLERAAMALKYNPKFAKYKREDADW